MIQIAMMASDARPALLRQTIARLEDPRGGGLFLASLARPPALYFASHPHTAAPVSERWTVTRLAKGKPYLPAFWRVLVDADPRADLLWLEDDIWCAAHAIGIMEALEAPPWAGCVSFFDFRNECRAKGFFRMPFGRPLWGTQAIKIPAGVLERMQHLARARPLMPPDDSPRSRADAVNSWDGWLGRACEILGLYVALYTPSLVQHMGTTESAISPDDHTRPVALNFPEAWPQEGKVIDPYWCDFHGTRHEVHSICPRVSR